MKLIDAHTHVFEQLCGFGPRGELRPIGGGKARWANGDEIEMIPPGLGERSFTADTLAALLRENHVERAVLLQGSFYGFQNEYVLESARRYPDLFVPAATCDPFCKEAEYLLHRFIHEKGFRIVKFETSSG
ncbi:MAG: amidohydrolase family protein, partial [Enterocloster bolteae]